LDSVYEVRTSSSTETRTLASKLAVLLKGGEVVELTSDLGGGKTTFTQGMTAALGYDGEVTSPTFTLSNIYRLASGLEIHHYDLYRLNEGGIVGDELSEDMGDPVVITVIEWAGAVSAHLPEDRLQVEIVRVGDDDRLIRFLPGGSESTRIVEELRQTNEK